MDGFVERVFPIRIQIDPERECLRRSESLKTRLKEHVTTKIWHLSDQTIGTSAESFSYKRLERHRCHDDAFDASQALIQGFGALLALQPTADGQYCVYASSDNTLQLIGYSPEALFAQNDFCELVVESHKLDFCRRLQSLFNNLEADRSAIDVFHVSLMTMDRQSREFWCTAHIPKEPKDIIICELEPLHSVNWSLCILS
jgi:light-regulated signal transduction histidine kinase (bacteriophytochrome)